MIIISVVVPLYLCSKNIVELADRLHGVMRGLHVRYELIFVDDGSPDDEWKKIVAVIKKYPFIVGIKLIRNVGQQTAIAVGLSQVHGLWTVVMDGDLQDRPEDIPILFAAAKKNRSVVIGRRTFRRISLFYLLLSRIYHVIIVFLSKKPSDASLGNFSVLDEKTRNLMQRTDLVCRSYLQTVRRIAPSVLFIDVFHDERSSGSSSYTLQKLINLAFITFSCWRQPVVFSKRPYSYKSLIEILKK